MAFNHAVRAATDPPTGQMTTGQLTGSTNTRPVCLPTGDPARESCRLGPLRALRAVGPPSTVEGIRSWPLAPHGSQASPTSCSDLHFVYTIYSITLVILFKAGSPPGSVWLWAGIIGGGGGRRTNKKYFSSPAARPQRKAKTQMCKRAKLPTSRLPLALRARVLVR